MKFLAGIFQVFITLLFVHHTLAFDPNQYPQKTVLCPAVRRLPKPETAHVELSYVDIGHPSQNTILMVHGWPGIWSNWARQIPDLQNENYRLLVPDVRGFGNSAHPDDPKASHTMEDLVQDMMCILDHEGVTSATCMGHDWGAQPCYEAARMRPDIFNGVIGVTIPYLVNAGNYTPVKDLVPYFAKLAYQVYFDERTYDAAKELGSDTRRTLRATYRTVSSPPPDSFLESETSYLDAWKDVPEIPPIPFLSSLEEDYLVAAFQHSRFLYTLGFYTDENRRLSYTFDQSQGNLTIPQPVLSILPTQDPVANWTEVSELYNSTAYTPNLEVKYFEGAHWVHLENSEPVNEAIIDWLHRLYGA